MTQKVHLGTIFEKDSKSALNRVRSYANREGYKIVSKPRLAPKQVNHITGYKTWIYKVKRVSK